MLSGAVIMAVLLVPMLASATHITDLVGLADCEGWAADLTVHWRSTVWAGDLDYVVVLTNADGEELEVFEGAMELVRDDGQDQVYSFGGVWEGMYQSDGFTATGTFHLVAPHGEDVEESTMGFEVDLGCTVDESNQSWSSLKASYR